MALFAGDANLKGGRGEITTMNGLSRRPAHVPGLRDVEATKFSCASGEYRLRKDLEEGLQRLAVAIALTHEDIEALGDKRHEVQTGSRRNRTRGNSGVCMTGADCLCDVWAGRR